MVRSKGKEVSKDIEIGDKVFGVSLPQQAGCHAEYVVVNQIFVSDELFGFGHACYSKIYF